MARNAPRATTPQPRGNFISEWFGHRIYPVVASTREALADQHDHRCPFISAATGESKQCVKAANSIGVCTISTKSNSVQQDWLACPFRALGNPLLGDVTRRLFSIEGAVEIVPGSELTKQSVRERLVGRIKAGASTIVYLQDKLGGEISVSRTQRTPELSFDITLIELVPSPHGVAVGRYGILEVQTTDFHGSFKHAVSKLRNALDLHPEQFHRQVAGNESWSSERIEGPNISNVFKRTFYQMAFKFRIGAHDPCVGCALAIPSSVWDSWQRHLGMPTLHERSDGTLAMVVGAAPPLAWKAPAWIYVFDIGISDSVSPNPIVIQKVIATDAEALTHYALKVTPEVAMAPGGSVEGVLTNVHRRLRQWWPDLSVSPPHDASEGALEAADVPPPDYEKNPPSSSRKPNQDTDG